MKRLLMIGFLVLNLIALWAEVGPPGIAQDKFPTKPITLLVGFAPGGGGDVPLRYMAPLVSKKLGQPVVVINREGGGGAVSLTELKYAKPDGYTICFLGTGGVMVAHIRKVDYDPVNDFTPIIQYMDLPAGICVRADSPFKTLGDLVAYAKVNPGKATYAFAGVGTPQHVAMVQLEEATKVDWIGVPMGGGVPVLTALLGGHVTFIAQTFDFWKYVESGEFRLLAILTAKRLEGTDAPTLIDLGYNIAAPSIIAVTAPKGIPKDRVEILHDAFYEAMQTPGFLGVCKTFNAVRLHRNPQELQKYVEFVYTSTGKVLEKIKKK